MRAGGNCTIKAGWNEGIAIDEERERQERKEVKRKKIVFFTFYFRSSDILLF